MLASDALFLPKVSVPQLMGEKYLMSKKTSELIRSTYLITMLYKVKIGSD